MAAPRKIFLPNKVYFVSTRIEEGLPLIPVLLMKTLIWSAIARAYIQYPQGIIAVKVQGNHIHLILRCISPQTFPLFVGFIKQEITHYINRLLGRKQKRIWVSGYDSPIFLTSDKVIDRLGYIFTISLKDNLVASLDEDPYISTLDLLSSENPNPTVSCYLIPRDAVTSVANPDALNKTSDSYLQSLLEDEHPLKFELPIEPFGFKDCFLDTKHLSLEELEKLIHASVTHHTEQATAERGKASVIGRKRLLLQSILKAFIPKKFGKKMICMSSDIEERKTYISWHRVISERAKEVYQRWKKLDFSVPFPLGAFPPSGIYRGSLLEIMLV